MNLARNSAGMFHEISFVRSPRDKRLDASTIHAVRTASGVVKRPPIIGPGPIHVSLQVKYQYAL